MELKKIDFTVVDTFEKKVAEFFGAPYGIAVDSCTHGIELSLRYCMAHSTPTTEPKSISVPKRTYISVPFLAYKLGYKLNWRDEDWKDYYYITTKVIDAAVLWKRNSYIPNTFMNISFQYQKHLAIGRGGMILTDDKEAALELKKMSYDGRLPNIPWREQDIDTIGYHYYLTPEAAQRGLYLLDDAINTKPRQWTINDWPDLTKMKIFKKEI